jgi:hypothetical protein
MESARLQIVTRCGKRDYHERDARQAFKHLLATVTDAEHRAALRLMPRFEHLSMREAYIAAMAKVGGGATQTLPTASARPCWDAALQSNPEARGRFLTNWSNHGRNLESGCQV